LFNEPAENYKTKNRPFSPSFLDWSVVFLFLLFQLQFRRQSLYYLVFELPAAGYNGGNLFSGLFSDSQIPARKKIFSVRFIQFLYAHFFVVHYCACNLRLPHFFVEFQYFGDAAHEQKFLFHFDPGFPCFWSCKFCYAAEPQFQNTFKKQGTTE